MKRSRIGAALALLALSAGAAAAREADPFYVGLLREGIAQLARGEPSEAAQSLQIACFGLLEEPKLLAEGLTHLGLAQAKMNDGKAFRATFDRLAVIETRFHAYRDAELTAQTRAAFAEQAAALVPPAALAATPGFEQLAADRVRSELAKLSPRQRRKEIERRLKATPADPLLLALLAELEPAARRVAPKSTAAPAPSPPPPAAPPAPKQSATPESAAASPEPLAPRPPLSAADTARLAEARGILGKARVTAELDEAWKIAREVADRNPDAAEAQLLAGEIAYRAQRFTDAVHYLTAAGETIRSRPTLLFSLAVSQFESGDREGARRSLEGSLSRIQRTPFVERWVEKINGAPPEP